MNNEKQPMDKATKYQTKYRSVLFGSLSLVLMAIAIIFYENQFSIFGDKLPTVLTFEGVQVNDSFLFFILFGVTSVLLALTGIIYAIKNRKILGFLLSSLVFVGIGFIGCKTDTNPLDLVSKFNIQDKTSLVQKVKDDNTSTVKDIQSNENL